MSNIEHPSHYNKTKTEVWDVLDEFFGSDPLLWNAGKYLLRAGKKGPIQEDLWKCIQYLERRLMKEEDE